MTGAAVSSPRNQHRVYDDYDHYSHNNKNHHHSCHCSSELGNVEHELELFLNISFKVG
jgi:hypothetical protein